MSTISAPSLLFLESDIKNWACKYGHDWVSSYETTRQVLVEGELKKWDEVAKDILKQGKLSSDWRYDYLGFRRVSPYKWKKLEPVDKQVATGLSGIEVITRELGPWGSSRHCYMRLINKEGDVYSVGFCGPTSLPFAWQRGTLMSPDPKEALNKGERVTHITIDEAKYNEIFARIESDKRQKKEAFHLLYRNCSTYTTEILAKHLDIELNNREFVTDALQRSLFQRMGIPSLPNFIKSMVSTTLIGLRYLFSSVLALGCLCVGASFVKTKKIHQEAFEATFGEKRSRETQFERFKAFARNALALEFVKPYTGWRVSIWQDKIHKKFGSNQVTIQQARSVRLSNCLEDMDGYGLAFSKKDRSA